MSADQHGGRYPDDLTIPFIFVPHGAPESPELAAFKARYPDWFSIPATFVPRPRERDDYFHRHGRACRNHPRLGAGK